MDAGAGLLLRGEGDGTFRTIPAARSGISVLGEMRGAAVSDFDADGREDLVVAQNGNATRLFRGNQGAPKLRVRLWAGAANPEGIGATLYDSRGSSRQLNSGSGYWSQGSSALLLEAGQSNAFKVRWPGGVVKTYSLTVAVSEVQLRPDGGIRAIR